MYTKISSPLLFFIATFFSIAQEKFLVQELDLKKSSFVIKSVLPIVDENTGNFALFFNESKILYAYLYDQNRNKVGQFYTDELPRKYGSVLGYGIEGNTNYVIYSSNGSRTKFLSTTFDFKGHDAVSEEVVLELGNEIFVQGINIKNDFCLITINKKDSNLIFYKFIDGALYNRKVVNLSGITMLDKNNKSRSLYKLLADSAFEIVNKNGLLGSASFKNLSFEIIDHTVPSPMEIVSKKNKLYVTNNKLTFTLDENKDITQILTVDLTDFSHDYRVFDKPLRNAPKLGKKTNSFLFQDHLLLIGLSHYGLEFQVIDFSSGKTVKKYSVLKDQKISFSNSPVVIEGSIFNRYREMEETEKLIRKTNRTNIGISLYQTADGYEISIGGSKEVKQGMPMVSTSPTADSFGSPLPYSTSYNYYYFEGQKSIYLTGLFNSRFEHLEGNLQPNGFDKIYDFKSSRRKEPYTETVFQYDNHLIWGEYNSAKNAYVLRKFSR